MGSGGGSSGTSETKASVPPELSPLYTQTGKGVQGLQNAAPLTPFTQAYTPSGYSRTSEGLYLPTGAPEGTEAMRLSDVLRPQGRNIESSPALAAARESFRTGARPNIEQGLTMRGLGRSPTAISNALAKGEAQFMYPAVQQELQREEAAQGKEYSDFLRQQGLAEQALFGPLNQLPSTIGQSTKTTGGGK